MTQRETALTLARIAGYHDDSATFTRLIIEKRVNRQAMQEAFLNGRQAKASGMKCSCHNCRNAIVIHPYVSQTINNMGQWK